MSLSDTHVAEPAAPLAAQPDAAFTGERGIGRRLGVLIRRELWEHRAVWIAPLVTALLLIACAFPATIQLPHFNSEGGPAPANLQVYAAIQWASFVPQFILMAIVLNFYLLDCLYAERKDRSILFWKSLPVSDGLTVTSKLVTALLVVPLGTFVLTAMANLAIIGILNIRAHFGQLDLHTAGWDALAWLKVEAMILVALLMSALWFAPVAAYFALLSAWARRAVFLWATLPPLVGIYVEWAALRSHHLLEFLEYRSFGIWHTMKLAQAIREAATLPDPSQTVALAGDFSAMHVTDAVLNIDLWLGIVAAVALGYLAARIRRYRDDT